MGSASGFPGSFRSSIASAALVVMGVSATARAASIPDCADFHSYSLPVAKVCLARWRPVGDKRPAIETLLSASDAYREKEEFGGAETTLACAAAQVGDNVDLRSRYEIIRRYGLLDYRHEEIPRALERFECALSLAKTLGDRAAIAKQLKNSGSARRRLGDYMTALVQLQRSLDMMRLDGDPDIGSVLNNIADIHRDSGRLKQAEDYYLKALEVFRRNGDVVRAMHVYDSMAELAQDRGDARAAMRLLETADNELQEQGNHTYRLLIYAGLARAALAGGDVVRARRYCGAGLALAEEEGLQVPWQLELQTARADRLDGRLTAAGTRLRLVLEKNRNVDHVRAEILEELGIALKESGSMSEAFDAMRESHGIGMRSLQAKNDQQLLWLSEKFMAADRERENSSLKHQNQVRTLQLWLMATFTLAGLLIAAIILLRRQQYSRLREAKRKARYKEMIMRYQREADALSSGRELLQALLDSREDAVCLLDAEGQVLAISGAADRQLAVDSMRLEGAHIADAFDERDRGALSAALERMEDCVEQFLEFHSTKGDLLTVKLTQWGRGDGRVVMEVSAKSQIPSSFPQVPVSGSPTTPTGGGAVVEAQIRERFRFELVDLMQTLVEIWERSTGSGRLELAEKSRIWRINIDDGRLRARAMERYLAVSKLPRNPRWRDVLRSAYFVLAQCTMGSEARDDLQRRVDSVLAYTRRDASG